MNPELVILRSLEIALADAAAANALPIAYENVRFVPGETQAYLEAHLLPATVDNPTLGDGSYRQPGIFQVTVVAKAGNGSAPARGIAGDIAAQFPRGRTVHHADGVRLLIDETPTVRPGAPDGDWYRVPVDIGFTADVTPA